MQSHLVRRTVAFLFVLAMAAMIAAGCGASKKGAAGAASDSVGLDYVNSKSVFYMVIDTDFEGKGWDKFDKLAGTFSGWKDAKADMIKEVVENGDDDVKWKDIKPWLVESAGLAVTEVDASKLSSMQEDGMSADTDSEDLPVLVWIEVSDEDKAMKFFKKDSKKDGSHGGQDIYESEESDESEKAFWTLKDGVFLMSPNRKEVENAIDVKKDGKSVSEVDGVKEVAKKVEEDSLMAFVVNGDAVRAFMDEATKEAKKEDPESAEVLDGLIGGDALEALNGMSFGFAADTKGFRITGFTSYDKDKLGDFPMPENTNLDLVKGLPESTLFAVGGNGLGEMFGEIFDSVKEGDEEVAKQISEMEATFGVDIAKIFDAMKGEFSMGVSMPEGGVESVAGGTIPPIGITFATDDASAVDTAVDSVAKMMGQGGAGAPFTVAPAGDATKFTFDASGVPVNVFYKSNDKYMGFATTEDYIDNIGQGATLEKSESFKSAWEAAGAPDKVASAFWLDIPAIMKLAGPFLGENASDFEKIGGLLGWSESTEDSETMEVFLPVG